MVFVETAELVCGVGKGARTVMINLQQSFPLCVNKWNVDLTMELLGCDGCKG